MSAKRHRKPRKNPAGDMTPYLIGGIAVAGVLGVAWLLGSKTAAASSGNSNPPVTNPPVNNPAVILPRPPPPIQLPGTWTMLPQPWAMVAGKTYRVSAPMAAQAVAQAALSVGFGGPIPGLITYFPDGSGGYTPALPADWPAGDPNVGAPKIQFMAPASFTFPASYTAAGIVAWTTG